VAIDWSHLPKDVISKVCMCGVANGFRLDPESEYWVHAKCGKPTFMVGVRECDSCSKAFVPKKYQDSNTCYLLGIECDDCNPD
jgi:hypothetical protein